MKDVILLTAFTGEDLDRLRAVFGGDVTCYVVDHIEALRAAPVHDNTSLISFGTGVIVPPDFLRRLRMPAYNVHAASPDFPGRDPHHHAVYRGATRYGATLHRMEARVDSGAIVAIECFDVTKDVSPRELLQRANEAGLVLVERLGARLLQPEPLPALKDIDWGPIKTRRSDLLRMSSVTPLISASEFERRFRAFDGGAHDNLTLQLHGHTFRIDKRVPIPQASAQDFNDFSEDAFRELLRALKRGGYRFARYGEAPEGRHVLWRHDVDFSMHRAARLARIEAEEGATATYFVNAHSAFYSLLEPEILRLCKEMRAGGHEFGLHFDASAYPIDRWSLAELEAALVREQRLLEMILDAPVRSVSWHNPDLSNLLDFDAEVICGLHNAYGARLRGDYAYCSDSNGYWRYRPMAEVISEGSERLHLLTHPAWWTPEPMPPSDRIDRAILGRARAVRRDYDELLALGGRKNVTE